MKKIFLLIGCFFVFLVRTSAQEKKAVLYFNSASDQLSQKERLKIDSLLGLTKKGFHVLAISGHCDSIGGYDYNMELSRRRVSAVVNYFSKHGIKADTVFIKGYGFTVPARSNETEIGRSLNRRVEITYSVIEKVNAPALKEPPVLVKVGLAPDTTEPHKEVVLENDTYFERNDRDTTLRMRNMNFHGGVDILLQEAYPSLQYLLEIMQQFPQLRIRIEGHICCNSGDTGFEMELSINRAKRVYDFLVAGGIDSSRLGYIGFGGTHHLVPEYTERDRSANRRVEIRILNRSIGVSQVVPLNYNYLNKINPATISSDSSFALPLFFHMLYPKFHDPSRTTLETLLSWLNKNPTKGLSFKLDMGFESDHSNMTRIQSLLPLYYLISKGINPRRLRYEGYYSSYSEEEMRLRLQRYRKLPDARIECRVFKWR